MNADHHEARWTERVQDALPVIAAVLLWTFTGVRYRPGIELLLLLGIALVGVVLFARMALHWGRGMASSPVALAGCAFGVLLITYAGIELSLMPTGPHPAVRVLFPLLLMVVVAYGRRAWTQEKAAQ